MKKAIAVAVFLFLVCITSVSADLVINGMVYGDGGGSSLWSDGTMWGDALTPNSFQNIYLAPALGENILTPAGDVYVGVAGDGYNTFFETASGDMTEGLIMHGAPEDSGIIVQRAGSYKPSYSPGLHIFSGETNEINFHPIRIWINDTNIAWFNLTEGMKVPSGLDVCIDGGNCLSGAGSGSGGWTDDGTIVRLTTATDKVAMGTSTPWSSRTLTLGGTGGYGASIILNASNPRLEWYANTATSGSRAFDIVSYSDALQFRLLDDGFMSANKIFMKLSDDTFVVNDNNADLDFQIKGDTNNNVFFVDSSNERVGIGTTNPTGKLEINMGSTDYGGVKIIGEQFSAVDTATRLMIKDNTGNIGWYLSAKNDGSFAIHEHGVGDHIHIENTNGRVGIGTETPDAKLDVAGAIVSGTATITADTDNYDVSGINTLFCNTESNDITIGGLSGGVDGQNLHIIKYHNTHILTIKFACSGASGSDRIWIGTQADLVLGNSGFGGYTLVYSGTANRWFTIDPQ